MISGFDSNISSISFNQIQLKGLNLIAIGLEEKEIQIWCIDTELLLIKSNTATQFYLEWNL